MKALLSNEEWHNIKKLLKQNGYIPTKKLVYEAVEKMENELDHLTFGIIDTHCKEEQQEIEEQRKLYKKSLNRTMAMWFGLLSSIDPVYSMNRGGKAE